MLRLARSERLPSRFCFGRGASTGTLKMILPINGEILLVQFKAIKVIFVINDDKDAQSNDTMAAKDSVKRRLHHYLTTDRITLPISVARQQMTVKMSDCAPDVTCNVASILCVDTHQNLYRESSA